MITECSHEACLPMITEYSHEACLPMKPLGSGECKLMSLELAGGKKTKKHQSFIGLPALVFIKGVNIFLAYLYTTDKLELQIHIPVNKKYQLVQGQLAHDI